MFLRKRPRRWQGKLQTELRAWTIKDAVELYNVNGWGRDFFDINEAGNVEVTPGGDRLPRSTSRSWSTTSAAAG